MGGVVRGEKGRVEGDALLGEEREGPLPTGVVALGGWDAWRVRRAGRET